MLSYVNLVVNIILLLVGSYKLSLKPLSYPY
jgi:hypothetical protein